MPSALHHTPTKPDTESPPRKLFPALGSSFCPPGVDLLPGRERLAAVGQPRKGCPFRLLERPVGARPERRHRRVWVRRASAGYACHWLLRGCRRAARDQRGPHHLPEAPLRLALSCTGPPVKLHTSPYRKPWKRRYKFKVEVQRL